MTLKILVLAVAMIAVVSLPDAPVEWLELKVMASKFSDPNVVSIGPSELHGRGIMLAKNVKKAGRIPLLQFFEVSMLGVEKMEQSAGGMVYREGFIPAGSDLDLGADKEGGLWTSEEAIKACEDSEE